MDSSEAETALIATNADDLASTSLSTKWITHMEIDPSLIFGIMGNSIIYPEHNPLPRNAFSCGQSKQAVSLYHSNYQMRMDKMGVILNYGQIPLVKSRYLEHINHEEMPYGVNALVAIMSYTGYNVEDAILINKGSIDRGMFRTSYFTTYESREESAAVNKGTDSHFANIEKNNVKIKKDVDYSLLDKYGIIREGTQVNDKTVLIGKLVYNPDNPDLWIDDSTVPKKGQLGTVDKAFFTMGEEGFNVAKVRISEERVPAMGDKMASRAGQKGTLGLIVPEENMPYTADGIRPDLIINPHALPSRMTIGQIIESMFGIVCTQYGGFGDCTAFQIRGSNESTYAPMLVKAGFHSSGNHVMYNGMTGAMLSSDIFMGPTYYMRLKHMVKDKINFRAGGPMTMLTRQPVQGRANDGGLRIGEMERDGVLAHGMSQFLDDSFMKRADEYCMAVCNVTGTIAIYNPSRNLFLSPFADGPIQFSTNMDGSLSLNSVSRFGRSFSVVRVPYSLKLLMHELGCMGIQMRIVTDKNIDQLLNLSQSSNAIQLLNVSNDDELMKRVREFKQSLGPSRGAVGLKEDFWKPNSDMIQTNKYDEPTTLTTYDAAVSYAMSHIHTISTLCATTSASNKPFVHAIPLNPLTINGPWSFDAESVERSMNLIFNVLHTNCYLVAVHSPTLVHIVKCEPDGIPGVYETQLAEYNRVSKRPVPMANVRIMNCIVKERSSVSTFNREFEQWVNERNSATHGHGGLPVGVYIFNLTDALILRDDNRPPWEPYSAPLNGMMPTYLPICGYSGAQHYCDVPIPNYDDMAFVMSGSVITTKYNVWESKINKAVFRGGSTGCGVNADTNMRIRLAEMAAGSSDAQLYLDAGLTTINRNQPRFDGKVGLQLLQTTATTVDKMDMVEQGKYKYIIHIDGNVAAYRLLYTMQLGSVILKVQGAYQLWFEHLLQDGVNCVFIKPDLSDLLDKIRWCTQNDTLCKNIANNGVMLSKTLLTANCVSDTIEHCMDTMRRVACKEELVNEPEQEKGIDFEAHTPDEPPPEHLLAGKIKMQIGNQQPMLPVVSDLTVDSDILATEEDVKDNGDKAATADSNPEDTKKIVIA
jgi:hypothetical protein